MAESFDQWRDRWISTAEERGHTLQRYEDEDGAPVDVFAGVDGGFHNGPLCTSCGWAVCMHCAANPDDIPTCLSPQPRSDKEGGE